MRIGTTLGEDSGVGDECQGQATRATLSCHVIFTALGLLLIAAAAFKTYHVYSQPMPRFDMVGTLALICLESCFGTWLLMGVRSAWTLRTAVVCFAAFASVSAYKYLNGEPSCGCFGTL